PLKDAIAVTAVGDGVGSRRRGQRGRFANVRPIAQDTAGAYVAPPAILAALAQIVGQPVSGLEAREFFPLLEHILNGPRLIGLAIQGRGIGRQEIEAAASGGTWVAAV